MHDSSCFLCPPSQDGMRDMVMGKATRLEQQGWREYKLEGH
jgi:hypothetical protein